MMHKGFGYAAPFYDRYANVQKKAANLIENCLACSPNRVLDIGCGTGLLTQKIAKKYPKAKIDAIDASESMVSELAKHQLAHVTPICMPYHQYESTIMYDLIVSNAALHWMNIQASLVKIGQQLHHAGSCFFTIFGSKTSHELNHLLPLIHQNQPLVTNGFLSEGQVNDCGKATFQSWSMSTHTIIQPFGSVIELLNNQKKTGVNARNQPVGLWTHRQLDALQDAFYDHYGQVQLSHVIYLCQGRHCV